MAETLNPDLFDALDEGDVTKYVDERLFDGKIDSLERHLERKKALADQVRYSVLYLLYEYGEISRKRLATETGRDSNKLQHHLDELLETNLITEIPAPEDADGRKTYYRITTLGKQEIASDVEHIVGGNVHDDRFEMLGDPELIDEVSDDSNRIRPFVVTDESETAELNDRRQDLRSKWTDFQEATASQD